MPFDDILCSWLVRSALVSLTILLIGSGAVLIWRQPLRRVRIIELVLAGCLLAPWLGMVPGYPQFSVVRSHSPVIQKPEAPLPLPEPKTEPAISEQTMPFPALDRATPEFSDTQTIEVPADAFEIRPWISTIYLAGVAIGAGWWLVGIVGLVRLLWSSQPAPSRCRELLAEISSGRSDRVRLLVSRHLKQPFASAWGRAVIVLPENLCGDEQPLRWCLAHEWAHVDGHDFRTWLLAGLARVLFFYQPLLWWLRRQLRLCQDFIADSQAARHAPEVEDYAEFLTARAAAGRLHPALGLSMGCRKSELYRRVIMLLKNESLESRTPRLWTVSVTLVGLMLVAVVAAVSLVPRAVAEEKPAISQSKEAGDKTKEPPKELTVSPAKELTVDLGKGIKLEMILIPAGEFMMGSPDSDKDAFPSEKPQHRVRITKPFYLGKYLVTQEQWEAVMGNNPSMFKAPKNPVEQVSWDDCQQFLEKINAKIGTQGGRFVLPTEAQWEYACRAGSTTRFCFGDDESKLGEYAWYPKNWGFTTQPVGQKKPNAWGLYDMHGNVFEWCQDWHDGGYYGKSPMDDPTGPETGSNRVYRGGSWRFDANRCRSAFHSSGLPGNGYNALGLRVSRVPAEAITTIYSPSANDQSGNPAAAKPADEVSPTSDQSATKEGATTDSKPAPIHRLVAEPNTEEAKAIAEIEKTGGGVYTYEETPGKPVTVVNPLPNRSNINDAGLVNLKELPQLVSLNLSSTHVTDVGLVHLEGLTQLKKLSLQKDNITDAGLEHLKGLPQLEDLFLAKTNVTDAGLANIKRLTNLKSLELLGTRVTDAGLVYLKGLTNLQWLILSETKVSDAGLANVKGLTNLKSLDLWKTQVTDAGLAHLKGLIKLQSLLLGGTQVTDAGLANLDGLPQLQWLSLRETKVTDTGLEHLKRLRQIQNLQLFGTQVTDAGLANLNSLPDLISLDLGKTRVTDAGLEYLKGVTRLKWLYLDGTQVTDEGVNKLQQALPNCKIIRSNRLGEKDSTSTIPRKRPAPPPPKANDQSSNTSAAKPADEVSPASDHSATKEGSQTESKPPAPAHGLTVLEPNAEQAKAIAEIKKVGGKVWIDDKSVPDSANGVKVSFPHGATDADLEHLGVFSRLVSLDVHDSDVTDAGLERIKGLTKLQYLFFNHNKITDAGLEHLEALTQLKMLDLRFNRIGDPGLKHIRGLTKIVDLELTGTNVTDNGLAYIKGMEQLRVLQIGTGRYVGFPPEVLTQYPRPNITDSGLECLKGLTKIHFLELRGAKITDTGLKHLQSLKRLATLDLSSTDVTDAGLASLKGINRLYQLDLSETTITDAGLENLKGMDQLRYLDLSETKVTDAGVKKLQQALPNCKISR